MIFIKQLNYNSLLTLSSSLEKVKTKQVKFMLTNIGIYETSGRLRKWSIWLLNWNG